MHRVLAALRLMKGDQPARDVMRAESRKMRARVVQRAATTMDHNIPYFDMHLDLKCAKCGEVSVVPFTQGLG